MFDINTISAEATSEFKNYPEVLDYKLSNEFFVNATPSPTIINEITTPTSTSTSTPTSTSTATQSPVTINKSGSGFFLNSLSIAMAFIVPLIFVICLLIFKNEFFVFGGYNVLAVILGIFNMVVFIITLQNINSMKNTYNCTINNVNVDISSATPTPTQTADISSLTLNDLNLGTTIETKLNLHPTATLCSSSLNNNTYKNLTGSVGYYGYLAFAIALQIIQIVMIGYTGLGLPIVYYVFLVFNLVGLFLSLSVDIIANRMAYKCPDNVKTFNQLLSENKTNTTENVLTADETKIVYDNLTAAHIDDTYIICNSRTDSNIKFSGSNINPTFSGFLIVSLMLTLFTLIFMTIYVFISDNMGSSMITFLQWCGLGISAGVIVGMLSFISALDQSYKYPERVALGTGISSAIIPVIVKIVLTIMNSQNGTTSVTPVTSISSTPY